MLTATVESAAKVREMQQQGYKTNKSSNHVKSIGWFSGRNAGTFWTKVSSVVGMLQPSLADLETRTTCCIHDKAQCCLTTTRLAFVPWFCRSQNCCPQIQVYLILSHPFICKQQ